MKKTAYVPGLRVSEDLMERIRKAVDGSKMDVPALRRTLWEEYVNLWEKGEPLSVPPHLMTAKEAVFMEACLKALGFKSAHEFFQECVEALVDVHEHEAEVQRPLKFGRRRK
jgi:hypothetical protein